MMIYYYYGTRRRVCSANVVVSLPLHCLSPPAAGLTAVPASAVRFMYMMVAKQTLSVLWCRDIVGVSYHVHDLGLRCDDDANDRLQKIVAWVTVVVFVSRGAPRVNTPGHNHTRTRARARARTEGGRIWYESPKPNARGPAQSPDRVCVRKASAPPRTRARHINVTHS